MEETLDCKLSQRPTEDDTSESTEDNTSDSPDRKRPHLDLLTDVDASVFSLMDVDTSEESSVKDHTSDSTHAQNADICEKMTKPAQSWGVKEWVQFSERFSVDSEFDLACKYVDQHLQSNGTNCKFLLDAKYRSFADCRLCLALSRTGEKWETAFKSKKYKYLAFFFALVKQEQISNRTLGITTPGILDNAKVGAVRLRFSMVPWPCLGLQYARLALLLEYYTQMYNGQLIIHFDDVLTGMESIEYEARLLKDLQNLGIGCGNVKRTSDYFSQMVQMAESLISQGKAYVDNTLVHVRDEELRDGRESGCRVHSIEDNLKLWNEMIRGTNVGRECYLRGKLDMQSPNKYLRDPIYFDCRPTLVHHRTGANFKLYPTCDFSCAFIDAIEGISHAIRLDCNGGRFALYDRLLQDMGFPIINIVLIKVLRMEYTTFSKHELVSFVDEKIVDGWEDPRLPTVQSLVRRGVLIEALKQFVYEQGVAKTDLIKWDRLWTINHLRLKSVVYPVHFAILKQNRVLLSLRFLPGILDKDAEGIAELNNYEKRVTYSKNIWLENADDSSFSEGEEIGLVAWSSAKIETVCTDPDGKPTSLTGSLTGGMPFESSKVKLWLPAKDDDLVLLSLVKFDYLMKEKEVKADSKDYRASTKEEEVALGDSDMRNLNHGDIVLLACKGYYRCDVPSNEPSKPVVLFQIPKGRK